MFPFCDYDTVRVGALTSAIFPTETMHRKSVIFLAQFLISDWEFLISARKFLDRGNSPRQFGSVDKALTHGLQGYRFHSGLGHILQL